MDTERPTRQISPHTRGPGRAPELPDEPAGARAPGARAPSRRERAVLPAAAALWSAVCAGLGLRWLLDPATYPFAASVSDVMSGVMALVPSVAASVTFLVLGVAGIPLAVLLGRTEGRTPGRAALLAAGAAYAVLFAAVVPDVQVLAYLGYVTALAAPIVVVGLLVAGARRHRRNLIALGVVGAAVAFGVATGEIGGPTVQMLRNIRDGAGEIGLRPLVMTVVVAGGALFALLTIAAAGRGRTRTMGGRTGLERWGRVATWVAAACPMPYALIRMTWLTPWPQGAPGGPDAIGPGVRLFGILLGLAALGGAVLTLGLVSRWGETFPAWLPRLRGRTVPVMAAVVPATIVSAALCASVVSMVMMSVRDDAGWLVAAIPVPVWGPALALATYAYYRRRTDQPAPTASTDGP